MEEAYLAVCPHCGARNELPTEAVQLGRYLCYACAEPAEVPAELRRETPSTHAEPVQTEPNFAPSRYNTPEAMRQAELAASQPGCLVALLALCAAIWWLL